MHLFMAGAIEHGKRGQVSSWLTIFSIRSLSKNRLTIQLYIWPVKIEDRPTAAGFAWFPRGKGVIADAEREEQALESEETAREGPL